MTVKIGRPRQPGEKTYGCKTCGKQVFLDKDKMLKCCGHSESLASYESKQRALDWEIARQLNRMFKEVGDYD